MGMAAIDFLTTVPASMVPVEYRPEIGPAWWQCKRSLHYRPSRISRVHKQREKMCCSEKKAGIAITTSVLFGGKTKQAAKKE